MANKIELDPALDGVTHINIYSQGKTSLGMQLSHFAHRPFCHSEHGLFASMEGYWYWLTRQDEDLRHLYGYKAKQLGQSLPIIKNWHPERFRQLVCEGNDAKLDRHPDIMKALVESTLPLEHYYAKFYGSTLKVTKPSDSDWILAHFEEIRLAHNPEANAQNRDRIEQRKAKAEKPKEEPGQMGLLL